MNWFYAQQGARAGPVDDEGLYQLVLGGAITPDTLVWSSGMDSWKPYAEVAHAKMLALSPGNQVGTFAGTYPAQCSQCGGIFPASEMVRIEDLNACAGCKPLLLQKIRQGISPRVGAHGLPQIHYAGFWIRVGAVVLDTLILLPFSLTLAYETGAYSARPHGVFFSNQIPFTFTSSNWVELLFGAAFSMLCVGRFGGTPGKLICGLRIVRGDGSRVTYLRALARYLCNMLNLMTFDLSYLLVPFDLEKRGLHDRLAGTRVVYK